MREARFNSLVFGPDSDDPSTKTRGRLCGHQQPRATTQKFPVAKSKRPHPIPSRTRKLSSSEPMVLHGKPCGRVGRCREILRSRQGRTRARSRKWSGFFALWPMRPPRSQRAGSAFRHLAALAAPRAMRPNVVGPGRVLPCRWRERGVELPILEAIRRSRGDGVGPASLARW